MINLKIKKLQEQITTLINASGLPISFLYFMMGEIYQELKLLFELQCLEEEKQLQQESCKEKED